MFHEHTGTCFFIKTSAFKGDVVLAAIRAVSQGAGFHFPSTIPVPVSACLPEKFPYPWHLLTNISAFQPYVCICIHFYALTSTAYQP